MKMAELAMDIERARDFDSEHYDNAHQQTVELDVHELGNIIDRLHVEWDIPQGHMEIQFNSVLIEQAQDNLARLVEKIRSASTARRVA